MNALVQYDAALRALAEAKDIFAVKEVRDKAEGLRAFARAAKDRGLEIGALELRMRAERRVGQMLIEIDSAGGLSRGMLLRGSLSEPRGGEVTLEELGVDKKLSMVGQRLAKLTDEEFENRLGVWREQMEGLPGRIVASLLKTVRRPARLEPQPLPEGKFRVICPDPPWAYETWGDGGKDRGAENHYSTMPDGELAAIDVGSLAADDSVLFLWVTGPILSAGQHLPVIEAWGFKVSTIAFVWIKTNRDGETLWRGNGYSTRANAEYCILARRGSLACLAHDVPQVIVAPRGRHSEKPDEPYERIERLFPGPYVELFARRERPGWTCWGDELESESK